MNYSFQYIDIILLAMIAGFIFLRLRTILGKKLILKESKLQNLKNSKNVNVEVGSKYINEFDDNAKKEFISGAKVAYETIITDFSDSDNKLTTSKPLLSKKIYDQFNSALIDRGKRGLNAEITFIGVNSAVIKEHKKINHNLQVTVEFISEVITCVKNKNGEIVSGSPDKIKKLWYLDIFKRYKIE